MPRLSHSLIRTARRYHSLLPHLLRGCSDLQSAKLELKWLSEHVAEKRAGKCSSNDASLLRRLCQQRERGVPLQYLIGNEHFGDLLLKCRPGVLIPRPVLWLGLRIPLIRAIISI
jgi:methylase of polypeptide subunit release factors